MRAFFRPNGVLSAPYPSFSWGTPLFEVHPSFAEHSLTCEPVYFWCVNPAVRRFRWSDRLMAKNRCCSRKYLKMSAFHLRLPSIAALSGLRNGSILIK
jgi:hypothetical protein